MREYPARLLAKALRVFDQHIPGGPAIIGLVKAESVALRRIVGNDDPGIDRRSAIWRDRLQPRSRQMPDRPDIVSHLGFRGGRPPRHFAIRRPAVIDDTNVRNQHDKPPLLRGCCHTAAARPPILRDLFAELCRW